MTKQKAPQADDAVKAGKRASEGKLVPLRANVPGVRLLSDVSLERVRWMWRNWLARGSVAFLEGDPGLGKSTLVVDIAARITTGAPMPDGSPGLGKPAHVLFLLAEDTPSTLRARVEAAGGDVSKVVVLEFKIDEANEKAGITFPKDVSRIEQLARSFDVALIVIDPWFAFLDPTIDTHNDASSRRALTPVSKMAEALNAVVIALRHWNKGKGSAIQRGMGSGANGAAARAVMSVGPDPADEKRSVLAMVKTNLGPKPTSLGFSVVGTSERPDNTTIGDEEGAFETCRVMWHGENKASASDLAANDDSDKANAREAEIFLRTLLERHGGELGVKEAQGEMKAAGYEPKTAQRARQRIGARAVRKTFSGTYVWALPGVPDVVDTPPLPCPPVQHGPAWKGEPSSMLDTPHAGQLPLSNMSDDVKEREKSHGGQLDGVYARARSPSAEPGAASEEPEGAA